MQRTGDQIIAELNWRSPLIEKLLAYYLFKEGVIKDPMPQGSHLSSLIFETLLDAQQRGEIPGILAPKEQTHADSIHDSDREDSDHHHN